MYIDIILLLRKSLKLLFCSFNSALEKNEYNSSSQIPLGNNEFRQKLDFLNESLSLISFDESLNLILLSNKKSGSPSLFFSLYIIILEQIPIKFLNKTISFISSFIFEFFPFPVSNGIGGNSTL